MWQRFGIAAAIIIAAPVAAEEKMMMHAKGEFAVELKPVSAEGETPARMSIAKTFTGDLSGSSTGQMMMDGVEANGTRVYVALETVTGSLSGKDGSFILAHRGTMSPAGQQLSVMVVPDSGTGALAGLTGTLNIDIVDGTHLYTMDYSLPAT